MKIIKQFPRPKHVSRANQKVDTRQLCSWYSELRNTWSYTFIPPTSLSVRQLTERQTNIPSNNITAVHIYTIKLKYAVQQCSFSVPVEHKLPHCTIMSVNCASYTECYFIFEVSTAVHCDDNDRETNQGEERHCCLYSTAAVRSQWVTQSNTATVRSA